jgi:hypothetical protein
MLQVKMTAAAGLAATLLAGCGIATNPPAGTHSAPGQPIGRGVVDDPRTQHLECLKNEHLPAVEVGQTQIQVGPPPGGALIDFTPTPGAAQHLQITGQVQGAEVIGSALLYPNQVSERRLKQIEDCLAVGVKG